MSVLWANGGIIGKSNSPAASGAQGIWDLQTMFLGMASETWPRYVYNYFGDGSDGDVTISTDTNITSTSDGDIVVKNYGNLTVNSSCTLGVTNRCKGLLIYCTGNLTVNGNINMTGKGASVDPVAAGVSSTGLRIIRKKTGSTETLSASDLAGCGSDAINAEANQPEISSNGKIYTIARTGAAGGSGVTDGGGSGVTANPGSDGTTGQSGGGSSGGARFFSGPSGSGGTGTCFSGGAGGGATNNGVTSPVTSGSSTGGAGGDTAATNAVGSGAGNPAGAASGGGVVGENGTGGLLIIIVKGNVTIGGSGSIYALGKIGGNAQSSGGSSGGGNILLLHGGSYSNSGTVSCAGGASPGSLGAKGGDGSVQVDQIDIYI